MRITQRRKPISKAVLPWLMAAGLLLLCACGDPGKEEAAETEIAAEAPVPPEPTETGIAYEAAVSPLQAGFCVLTMQDTFRMIPDDSFGEGLTWSSSDETAATVEDGLILPVAPGRAEIFVTDGENSAAATVLVDTAPSEPKPAGRLLIETDGVLFESNLAAAHWALDGLEPHYMETDFVPVYESDGTYYVKAEYLFNVLCCAVGERISLEAPDGALPQLSGCADIRNAAPPDACCLFGGDEALVTSTLRFELPDGRLCGAELCARIYEENVQTGVVYYHAFALGEEIYQDAEAFLSAFDIEFSLRYDAQQKALIVSL